MGEENRRKEREENNDDEQRSDFLCPRGPPSHGRRIVGDLSPVVSPAMEDGRSSASGCEGKRAGSPAPAVAWYKDGLFTAHPELADGQTVEHASLGETVAKLRLSCASKETVGNYECRARSGEQELSAVTKVELA